MAKGWGGRSNVASVPGSRLDPHRDRVPDLLAVLPDGTIGRDPARGGHREDRHPSPPLAVAERGVDSVLAGYWLVDAGAAWRVMPHLQVVGTMRNLLNDSVTAVVGF